MDPILLDIPLPIVTDRLVIREPRVGEGVIINAAIVESFAELTRWMPWAKEVPTVIDTEMFVRQSLSKFIVRHEIPLLIFSRDEKRFIGSTGLRPQSWSPRVFEIGYWIRSSEASKGLMTEAVMSLAEYALAVLQANRLFIRCDDANPASARVAEKAGFVLEGVMRRNCQNNAGELCDMRLYARVA